VTDPASAKADPSPADPQRKPPLLPLAAFLAMLAVLQLSPLPWLLPALARSALGLFTLALSFLTLYAYYLIFHPGDN